MPQNYFDVPPRPVTATPLSLDANGYVFKGSAGSGRGGLTVIPKGGTAKRSLKSTLRSSMKVGKNVARTLTPDFIWSTMQLFKSEYRRQQVIKNIDHPLTNPIDLPGIVYTSIFNPADGSKNWRDLITGFVTAMKDNEDATLVLKLVTKEQEYFYDVVETYRKTLVIPHRCKVVLIREYLSDAQMMKLIEASSYYVTTTRAEGNCLPLMNYLAAGRPGITAAHSAIGDYFDGDVGFVIDSNRTPAFWPQEVRTKYRTSWHQPVWGSIVEQLRRSYDVAKHDRRTYDRLARNARTRMHDWLSEDRVYPLLRDALDLVAHGETQSIRRAA